MPFLRNCWYIAAWSEDVSASGMMARTILNEPVLLLRDNNGKIGAIRDMCPHRFAPLRRGTGKRKIAISGNSHDLARSFLPISIFTQLPGDLP